MINSGNGLMMTDIRYSIIIPHYDIPNLLERLLNTIPEREDIQVIVVDDCSPESDTYLGKYAFLNRSNVEFYITDKNGGGGYARNEGLKHAKGKWLLFADADDLFVDGFCAVIDEHYYDEEDSIYFNIKSVHSDNISRQSKRDIYWNLNCQNYLQTEDDAILRYKLTEPWAKMIRRRIIMQNNIRFDETMVSNDYLFSVQVGCYARKVKLVPIAMYILTQREYSVSSGGWADTVDNLKVRLDVAMRVQSFLYKNGVALKPMPIRGLMVLALKNYPSVFFSTLYRLHKQNTSIISLLWQMFFIHLDMGEKDRNTNICVSIVIVCMNNLENLCPCLDSIRKYTSVSCEILVVAYFFSPDNLETVRQKYPWVILIESNEIRGFAENNNLALKQAKGKYCFVLNDDTELSMPVIDLLFGTIKKLPDKVAIVSPVVVYPDGKIQTCGKQPINWITFMLDMLHLWNWNKGKYTNRKGVFKSYNIVGSAFLIKTEVFRKYGWFDEAYFFCPEDIALSTLLNKEGYECHVNSDVSIIHKGGMSGKSLSFIQVATRPAQCLGNIMFYSGNNRLKRMVLSLFSFGIYCLRYIYHTIKSHLKETPNVDYILSKGDLNCIKECFSSKTPKEIFLKYYHTLNR